MTQSLFTVGGYFIFESGNKKILLFIVCPNKWILLGWVHLREVRWRKGYLGGKSRFLVSQVAPWCRTRLPVQEMQETGVQSLGREDRLEWEMATHSSILAWKIPWTEEPGGPHSTGLQRVGQDWETEHTLSFHFISAVQEACDYISDPDDLLLLTHLRWCRKETVVSVNEHIICFSNLIVYGLGFSEH